MIFGITCGNAQPPSHVADWYGEGEKLGFPLITSYREFETVAMRFCGMICLVLALLSSGQLYAEDSMRIPREQMHTIYGLRGQFGTQNCRARQFQDLKQLA
jgi:hypothetical protein